jgi:hypothetical protein
MRHVSVVVAGGDVCVPGCIRDIKPAVILENLVDIDGNRSGKALGLSRAWMMRWRGKGAELESLSSAGFRLNHCAIYQDALQEGNGGMAGACQPAAEGLKGAAFWFGCATLIHPSLFRGLCWAWPG